MKYIHLFLLITLFPLFSFAHPGSAKTEEITVNGLKVIIKYSKNEVVSAKLFFKGGTANYTKANEGIESLALHAVTSGGTTTLAKDDFNAQAELKGIMLGAAATMDYATLSMNVVKKNWNDGWTLFSDMVCNPAFPADDFENIKQQMIGAAQEAESDPDTHLRNLAMINVFGDGPYARLTEGSPGSLQSLTQDMAIDYYKSIRRANNTFLVIVGDVKKEDIEKKVKAMASCFPTIPNKPKPATTDINITTPALAMEERQIATNYVRGIMNAPDVGSTDEMAMRIAMSIMGDKMFEEVRTKRNLSYAPAAFFPTGALTNPYSVFYVSTDSPSVAVKVMTDEVRRVIKKGFTEKELSHAKSGYLTQFYMGQETNSTQAEEIGKAELTTGYARLNKINEEVNNLTLDDINKAFRRYAKAINWTYLGDKKMVDEKVFKEPLTITTSKINPVNVNRYPAEKAKKKMKKK